MQILRRILILVVVVALLVTAYVYWAAEKEITKRKFTKNKCYKLMLLFETQKEAANAEQILGKSNIKTDYKYPLEDHKFEPAGYVVAQEFPRDKTFESIKQFLTARGFNIKEENLDSEEKFRLYVGPVYKSEAEAAALAENVYRKTIVKFKVETYYKKIPAEFHALIIRNLEKKEVDSVLGKLAKNGNIKVNYRLIKEKK